MRRRATFRSVVIVVESVIPVEELHVLLFGAVAVRVPDQGVPLCVLDELPRVVDDGLAAAANVLS